MHIEITRFALETLPDRLGWLKYTAEWESADETGINHGMAKITPAMNAGIRQIVSMVTEDITRIRKDANEKET